MVASLTLPLPPTSRSLPLGSTPFLRCSRFTFNLRSFVAFARRVRERARSPARSIVVTSFVRSFAFAFLVTLAHHPFSTRIPYTSSSRCVLEYLGDEALPADGVKPTFTEKPVIRQSDGKIIFECRLIADPSQKPTIEWQLKGKTVNEDSRHKYGLTTDKQSCVATLEISKPLPEDAGEYKLIAKNKHGEGSATITLNFDGGKPNIPDGMAPRFPKKPTIRQEGSSLILECVLEAKPFPTITWYFGAQKLSESARYKMNKKDLGKDTYQLTMEIKDPTVDDGGNYRCNAVNDLGESNANIALNLQELAGEAAAAKTERKSSTVSKKTVTKIKFVQQLQSTVSGGEKCIATRKADVQIARLHAALSFRVTVVLSHSAAFTMRARRATCATLVHFMRQLASPLFSVSL